MSDPLLAARLGSVLGDAMLGLMISVGHRVGLFARMAGLPAASSVEIARAAGLDEDRVGAWLGVMVAGRIVEHDGARAQYWLPPAHAAALTRPGGPAGLAGLVAACAAVEDTVVAGFRGDTTAGGFDPLRAALSDATRIDAILARVGVLEALRAGIDVLDVGAGPDEVQRMARAFPASRFERVVGRLAGPARADLVIALEVIGVASRPAERLAQIRAALRPGGTLLCVDVAAASNLADNADHPLGPLLYALAAVRGTPLWGQERAQRMLAEAGFVDVEVQRLPGDAMVVCYVAR